MKRIHTILLLCLLTLLICSCSKNTVKTETAEETESSATESEVPTPTATPKPIPTPRARYTPGDDLYGMLSVTGDVVIEPQYNYLGLFTEENLARFQDYETGLWGYINESGEEVIPAQYEDAQDFSEGLAAVKVDGLYGFIDVSGEMVIEPQFEGVGSEFAYERCVIQENGMLGVIDQTGVSIVKPQYKSIEMYCESYFIVQSSEGEYGIIDRDGEVVVEYLESEIYAVTDSGYYFVSGSDIENRDLMCDFAGNQYYVQSYSPSYPLYQIHSDSKIAFSSDGMIWGLMDLSSEEVILEEVYDSVYVYMAGQRGYISSGAVDLANDDVSSADNLAYIRIGGQAGFINISTGKTVVDCVYQSCRIEYEYIEFEDTNDKWGLMDLDGNILFEAKYDSIYCSPYGEFAVCKNGVNYIVDIDESVLMEIPIRNVLYFVDSVDCWFVTDSDKDADEWQISLMRRDGTLLIAYANERYITNYYTDLECYANPVDPSRAPFIVRDYDGEGTDSSSVLINSEGYVFDCPLGMLDWFPDQGVLVVIKEEGECGLISYDGTVLFPVQECHIFTNKDAGEEAEKYEYDTYNDTDYLIYTIPAQ